MTTLEVERVRLECDITCIDNLLMYPWPERSRAIFEERLAQARYELSMLEDIPRGLQPALPLVL